MLLQWPISGLPLLRVGAVLTGMRGERFRETRLATLNVCCPVPVHASVLPAWGLCSPPFEHALVAETSKSTS